MIPDCAWRVLENTFSSRKNCVFYTENRDTFFTYTYKRLKFLVSFLFHLPKPESKKQLVLAKLETLSLEYRTVKQPIENKFDLSELKRLVSTWKKENPMYLEEHKNLSLDDIEKIEELAKYSKFIVLMLSDKEVMNDCFNLIFRDYFPIQILVTYFKICTIDLKDCCFTSRIGFFNALNKNACPLKIENDNLLLKINKTFVSILKDDQKILCNDNKMHTWKELKNLGAIAKKFPGKVEFFQEEGLMLHQPQGVIDGMGNPIDTKSDCFWEKENFPYLYTISKEDLEKRFDLTITEDKSWVITIEGSCMDIYDTENAHGASTIYLPSKANPEIYEAYPCGKYAKKFPQTHFEKALFIGDTVEGVFTYPDPTPFYSQRLHGASPIQLSEKDGKEIFQTYGRDIWNFQFAGNNCSSEFQTIMEKKFGKEEEGGLIPNYFRQPLLGSKFVFPLNYLFAFINLFHRSIAYCLVHAVHYCFGSQRTFSASGRKTESLYENKDFCEKQLLSVPGHLLREIQSKNIKGKVWNGVK